jgi:DNA polymerase II large subunit
MDVASFYPLAFYEKASEHTDSKAMGNVIDIIEHRLGKQAQFEGYSFTHQTFNINEGNLNSSYMKLGAMSNKINAQLRLAEIIKAVDSKEVAEKVLTTHLLRDIAGNLSAFTKQKLRCKDCNAKYRRVPLSGKCTRCGGALLPTVYRKGIEKYLDTADGLVQKYDLGRYYQQRLALIRDELSSLFKEATPEKTENDKGKQMKLGEFL